MPDIDYSALFGEDNGAAQSQAAMLAQAMRQRRAAGTLGLLTGDSAMAATGKELAGNADQMEQALIGIGQHRASQQLQERHLGVQEQQMQNQLRHQQVLEQLAQGNQDLKGNEVTVSRDVMGNPIVIRKHQLGRGGVLPGATAAGAGTTRPPPGPGAPNAPTVPANPVDDIAQAIIDGKQPPDTKGLFRAAAPIRAALARRGFDLAGAQTDWTATQKHLATLNGPQQTRLMQAVNTAGESLTNIEGLYNEWKKLGGVTGSQLFNRVSLAGAKQLPGRAGEVARALEMNIADLTAELGNVYMGGNSPTDHALGLAKQNLAANWNEGQFREAISQARKNLQYRVNSIKTSGVIGASAGNKYAPAAPAAAAESAPTAGGSVTVIWKGARKTIPAARLQEAIDAGAKEEK